MNMLVLFDPNSQILEGIGTILNERSTFSILKEIQVRLNILNCYKELYPSQFQFSERSSTLDPEIMCPLEAEFITHLVGDLSIEDRIFEVAHAVLEGKPKLLIIKALEEVYGIEEGVFEQLEVRPIAYPRMHDGEDFFYYEEMEPLKSFCYLLLTGNKECRYWQSEWQEWLKSIEIELPYPLPVEKISLDLLEYNLKQLPAPTHPWVDLLRGVDSYSGNPYIDQFYSYDGYEMPDVYGWHPELLKQLINYFDDGLNLYEQFNNMNNWILEDINRIKTLMTVWNNSFYCDNQLSLFNV